MTAKALGIKSRVHANVLILPQSLFVAMWRLGFFFHEMGFGLLSVFLPLYVIAIGGSLVEVGILSATALFLAIPASFFWGYMSDRTRHYKRYILLSFFASAVLLYLFGLASSVWSLILLYSLMSIVHVAHEAPKNILIAEYYSRMDWEKSYASYEGLTETGWLIGLVLGLFTSLSGFSGFAVLMVCSFLNLIAFGLSAVLVADPLLVFERSLVSIEKSLNFVYQGSLIAARVLDGKYVTEKLRRENIGAFSSSIVLFSFATSMLFTPMPLFVSDVVKSAAIPIGFVFVVFMLNSGGGVLSYFFISRRSDFNSSKSGMQRILLLRGLFSFLLLGVSAVGSALYGVSLLTLILVLLGVVNAFFVVLMLSISMELIPAGKAGLFNVLVGVGGACGSLIGPLIASQQWGFAGVFVVAGAIFLGAYVVLKWFF